VGKTSRDNGFGQYEGDMISSASGIIVMFSMCSHDEIRQTSEIICGCNRLGLLQPEALL